MTNNDDFIVKCQYCGKDLPLDHKGPCPYCGKTGKSVIAPPAKVATGVVAHACSRARQKQKGFRKFVKEILQGWFQSSKPELKNGVDKVRIVDKERNEYHETVKDAMTGEVIHDVHEPLSQHKKQPKIKGFREEVKQMGSKGRKNIKKPKKQKEKKEKKK